MSLVLLSSDSADLGRAIAHAVAGRLAYRELAREVLARVAREWGIEEAKLEQSFEGSRGLLGLADAVRFRYLAYVQEAVLGELTRDDVVCHGVAAHLYVFGASHALKVRVLSDPDARVQEVAAETMVSADKARKAVERADARQRRWSRSAFGVDDSDPALYDLVVKTSQIGLERAVALVTETLGDGAFRTTTYSRKRLHELLLESRARAALVERFPDARVTAEEGRLRGHHCGARTRPKTPGCRRRGAGGSDFGGGWGRSAGGG